MEGVELMKIWKVTLTSDSGLHWYYYSRANTLEEVRTITERCVTSIYNKLANIINIKEHIG